MHSALVGALDHPDAIAVDYEDLVRDSDRVATDLESAVGWTTLNPFSQC